MQFYLNMQLATKIAYNTIVQFLSKALSTVLGLLAIALITRYLSPEGFGEYTAATTFLSFFAIIADMGLTLVTVQLISRPGADEPRILGNLLALRLVSAAGLLALAPLAAVFFPYSAAIKQAILIGAASFVFIALNQILVGLFQKNLRMDKVSIAEVLSRVVLLAATYWAVRIDSGLNGIIWAMVGASLVNFALHLAFSRRFVRLRLHFDFKYWLDVLKRSWPLALTIIFNLLYLKTDTLLLSLIPRESRIGIIAEVGLYGAAYKVIDVLITLPFMFAGIILPILTARFAAGLRAEFREVYQRSFDAMVLFALPMMVGTFFVARQTMVLVAGPEFAAAGPILSVLIIAAAAVFVGTIPAHAVIAIDKQRQIIGAYFFVAVSSIIGYAVLIPLFSYYGAAAMTIYSEVFIAIASIWLVYRYTRYLPSLKLAAKAGLACAVMAAALHFYPNLFKESLAATIAIGVLAYSGAVLALGAVKKDDIKILINRH